MFGSTSGDYENLDRFSRTLRQQWEETNGTPSTIDQVDYTYDYASNRLTRSITGASSLDQTYTYDGLHRLKTNDETGTSNDREWQLDQLGNWERTYSDLTQTTIEQLRTHNDVNELTASAQGTQKQYAYDDAGNMTDLGNGEITLVYDAWNRLVIVKDRDDNTITTNEYDGLNRRIIRDETGGSGVLTHFYYNQRWQVVETRIGTATTADKQYIYHPHYIDAVAVRYWDEDNSANNVLESAHYYLQDSNFNVTAIVEDDGTVAERYAYTPYGEVTILNGAGDADGTEWTEDTNGSDIDNEYLYTGRRRDPETRLQLNRERFYIPPLGRWANRDPIGYLGSPWNLYEYVRGMPNRLTDAYGLATSDLDISDLLRKLELCKLGCFRDFWWDYNKAMPCMAACYADFEEPFCERLGGKNPRTPEEEVVYEDICGGCSGGSGPPIIDDPTAPCLNNKNQCCTDPGQPYSKPNPNWSPPGTPDIPGQNAADALSQGAGCAKCNRDKGSRSITQCRSCCEEAANGVYGYWVTCQGVCETALGK